MSNDFDWLDKVIDEQATYYGVDKAAFAKFMDDVATYQQIAEAKERE